MTKKQVKILERLAFAKSHKVAVGPEGKPIGTITMDNSKTEFANNHENWSWDQYNPETNHIESQPITQNRVLFFKKMIGSLN